VQKNGEKTEKKQKQASSRRFEKQKLTTRNFRFSKVEEN